MLGSGLPNPGWLIFSFLSFFYFYEEYISISLLIITKQQFYSPHPEFQDCLHQPEIKLESLKDDVRNFLKTSGGRVILIPTENIVPYTRLCVSLFMTAFFSVIRLGKEASERGVQRAAHVSLIQLLNTQMLFALHQLQFLIRESDTDFPCQHCSM